VSARRASAAPDLGHVHEVVLPDGRTLRQGQVVSITGVRGRFTFRWSRRPDEVTVWGGVVGHESMRTYRIDRVRRIHRERGGAQ
jgi:hypothetical protein